MKNKLKTVSLISALSLAMLGLAPAQKMDSMPGMTHTVQADKNLSSLSGKAFDRAFLSMMIVHHQGAIDMSKAVINNVKDAQVKTWTKAVISAQQKEIKDMTSWLGSLGGVDKSWQTGMAKEMDGMLAALKTNKDSDAGFVTGMLPHHASAIEMATLALQKSSDARVTKLAREIIRTQADEMYLYRQWLIKRGI
ncbi:DUF305 domain-containing protein [Deinococcus detaillensis]|uniref:DUF305 domain-containing protein n=1 Tax=Deinococcus detaillensis TaxID=2592048 RepID=A0A553UZ73_9DEIO|nr:DUF305 domain-containing protein [Deinococcus detaillensis]TSA85517.1 DUF305 domain-containing protein [Deinococcus detaillensis]